MNTTRREALRSVALFGGALFFSRTLAACAVEPDAEGGEGSVDQSEDELVTCKPPVISANHGHSLVVSAADVAAGRAKSYSIAGAAGHDHTVSLTAAHFASLSAGKAVAVTSSNGAGHTHTVTVTCTVSPPLPATCGNGAKASAISANHGHALVVSKADVAAGVARSYSIQGSSSHPHQVAITAAQFQTLKTGKSISIASSSALGHAHTVTVICA